MKFLLFIFCWLSSLVVAAQTGNYFLSHFTPDRDRFNTVSFDMEQDSRGIFYFATQRGVIQFDGRNWELIRTNGAVYAIEIAGDGTLYVVGSKGFGKIVTDNRGLQLYEPIYEQPDAEYSFQLISLNNTIYFLNDQHIFSYSGIGIARLYSSTTNNWVSLNELFGKLFISTEEDSLLNLENDHVTPSNLLPGDSSSIIFSERYEDNYLIGTSDSRIFLCDESLQPHEIVLADAAYAGASVIVNATWVDQDLVALGTLHGGVMFINPATGGTEEIINYNTGLPDNEIYSIIRDRNHTIWVAHAYGFTRIAPDLPFRSFRYYKGLQGNLLCAINHNGNVYIGTSLGLYRLEREEFYDEIIYFVDVPVRIKQTSKETTTPSKSDEQKPGSEKKGLFNFLRKKKRDEQKSSPAAQPQGVNPPASQTKTVYRKEKRTKRILRAAHFAYKKVEGIDTKVTQLTKWRGKLIASSLSGAFEVDQNTTRPIIEDPVRFLFATENQNSILVSTNDDKLHRFTVEKTDWKEEQLIRSVNDPINYIFEEHGTALWLCGLDHVYRMPLDTGMSILELPINNADYERMVGISYAQTAIVASSTGFYFYDDPSKSLIKADTLPRPRSYFAGNNTLWFKDEHAWSVIGRPEQQNIRLLNLFQEIRFMTQDEATDILWIITGNNELLRFQMNQVLPFETTYPLFLKSIEQDSSVLARREFLRLDQENSSVLVEVIKPDYIGVRSVEYRYFLEGLHNQWSEWSANNNKIDFPYLPPGKYKLQVQSKDIFGRVADMESIQIEVLPPYWKRSWFYALEFGVFSLLVIASFRLSYRYRFISRVLSLLSIIILIEFIQTVAGSTFTTGGGPVVEFAVQVCIAFLILPVEGFLRKFMLRTIDRRGKYQVTDAEDPGQAGTKELS